MEAWLEEILPDDAAERCDGRCLLTVNSLGEALVARPRRAAPPTRRPLLLRRAGWWRRRRLSRYESRATLIDACLATAHIPFFLDEAGLEGPCCRWWRCDGTSGAALRHGQVLALLRMPTTAHL